MADDDDVTFRMLKTDILNLLGMKEVPNSGTNPNFVPHDGMAPTKVQNENSSNQKEVKNCAAVGL